MRHGDTNRGVAAGHGHLGEVGGALEAVQVGDEEFAAPGVLVAPEPEPVERHSDDRSRNTVVHQAGGDVGVVVLHPDEPRPVRARRARPRSRVDG